MERSIFEQFVAEALDELPEEFQKLLKNIAIVVEDEPNEHQRQILNLPRYMSLYGLYEGVPKTTWGADQAIIPHKITIFQKPIEESFMTEEEIKEQVKRTVRHEIGHYFGMSERELRRLKKT